MHVFFLRRRGSTYFCLFLFVKLKLILVLICVSLLSTSRKRLRTKMTPDFHLTYSKTGGNLGSESK